MKIWKIKNSISPEINNRLIDSEKIFKIGKERSRKYKGEKTEMNGRNTKK
ncbi:hypothetical protein [Oceanobacillus sp. J11TS1]|nr:hypothetical protein [Oceanobacillus sp. J11TS1]GIO23124.1 hypothetical protein J11TS1_17050 [Oceanobacillus sp. J11TS1]